MNEVMHTSPTSSLTVDRTLWLDDDDANALVQGTHRDPFSLLGLHSDAKGPFLRCLCPAPWNRCSRP